MSTLADRLEAALQRAVDQGWLPHRGARAALGALVGWRWRRAPVRTALLRAWGAAALAVGALPGDWPALQLAAAIGAAVLATRA